MTLVRLGFEKKTVTLPLARILPTRTVSREVLKTPKYRSILASVRKIGLIEPLAVFPERGDKNGSQPHYILLDGHLRFQALKEVGAVEAVCLISIDDEGFTYNRRVARMTSIQEHKMIIRAIEKGVPAEEIAEGMAMDVKRIVERQHLLDGIAPEVAEMLKDRMVTATVFTVLRKMKALRQIEAAEMMILANRLTVSYAKVLLAATKADDLVNPEKPKMEGLSAEDLARMEREMEKLQRDYRVVEESLGDVMLTLVVTKGYISKLLRNEAITAFLGRHHPDLATEIRSITDAVGGDARMMDR